MVKKVRLADGEIGFLVRHDIDNDGSIDKVVFSDRATAENYEDCFVKNEQTACYQLPRPVYYKRMGGNYFAFTRNEAVEPGRRSPDELADLIIDKETPHSVREEAFGILEDQMDLDVKVLKRLAKSAPQKYRDWAGNEIEWLREKKLQERARSRYVLPLMDAIIASPNKYEQWDIWKKDPLNPGMFFEWGDLEKISGSARSEENRKEAIRLMKERNRCEHESQQLDQSAAANKALLNCPNPHYWRMVLRSGLQPYKDQAAERLFKLAQKLPDSDRARGIYERILQEGTLPLKDRAAEALMDLGIANLSVTNLRYLMFYARGEERRIAIDELRGRDVTDPEQKKHIKDEIARCSRAGAEEVCAEMAHSHGSDLVGSR